MSLVEEGRLRGPIAEAVAKDYLKPLLSKKIDTLILGCTHYPLLKGVIQKITKKRVIIVDSAYGTVEALKTELEKKDLLRRSGKLNLKLLVSDTARNFSKIGSQFLGKTIGRPQVLKNV